MYQKHKRILKILFFIICIISFGLELNYIAVASEAINVVSISSAIYFGAYAGIQSSEKLKQNLKKPDKIMPEKSQLFIINHYLKLALFFCFCTIIISSISILLNANVFSILNFFQKIITPSSNHQTIFNNIIILLKKGFSSLAIGLFFVNLTLVFLIGIFLQIVSHSTNKKLTSSK